MLKSKPKTNPKSCSAKALWESFMNQHKRHHYRSTWSIKRFRARIKATSTEIGSLSSDTSHLIWRILLPSHPVIILPIPVPNCPFCHIQSILRLVQRQSIDRGERHILSTWHFVLAASIDLNAALWAKVFVDVLRPPLIIWNLFEWGWWQKSKVIFTGEPDGCEGRLMACGAIAARNSWLLWRRGHVIIDLIADEAAVTRAFERLTVWRFRGFRHVASRIGRWWISVAILIRCYDKGYFAVNVCEFYEGLWILEECICFCESFSSNAA